MLGQHAYDHVPYYRRLFDSNGVRPGDICRIDELQKLPLLGKSTVRENLSDLMSDNHDPKKILKITTSGSTGEPFVMYADQHQLEMRWAANLRGIEWTGYRFGDKQARLWHQTIGMSRTQIIREWFDALLSRRLFIPAYEMSDKNLAASVAKLKRHQPTLIDGYAESFNFLASYFKNHELEDIHPLGIVSSAQALTDQSRDAIEEAFGCEVFDKYGAREFSGIAYESDAHNGHLVTAENYIVEVITDGRPAKPGEIGEVVITDLNNYCMPLIRYRIGDLAVAMDNTKPSSYGRGLPRIGRIEGRTQSIIFCADGKYLPGTFFMHYFKDFENCIRQFQVIQEQVGSLTIRVVTAPYYTQFRLTDALNGLKHHVGETTKITVEFVGNIPLGCTGKHQATINKSQFDIQDETLVRQPFNLYPSRWSSWE